MPYASEKQMRYLHAAKPEVAAKFDADIRAKGVKAVKYRRPKKRKRKR